MAASPDVLAADDLAERFGRIWRENVWGSEVSRSGVGSEGEATVALSRLLPELLSAFGVSSLVDAPCGDASWVLAALPSLERYVGLDIVPELVAELQAGPAGHGRSFAVADVTRDPLPQADALLCRDCLVHLSDANVQAVLANIRESGVPLLIATTFTDLAVNVDCEDGDWRPLNLTLEPFGLGVPLALLYEGCTEADRGYTDKALGVWAL